MKAAAADRTSPGLMRVNGRIVNINKMKAATDQWNESGAKTQEGYDIVADWKEKFRDYRAKQRIKRTCAVCGETAPLSSHAFAYCGGCRHASIPRVDRPRYCSEACQRAHWAAAPPLVGPRCGSAGFLARASWRFASAFSWACQSRSAPASDLRRAAAGAGFGGGAALFLEPKTGILVTSKAGYAW